MSEKLVLKPGQSHPISIEPLGRPVTVMLAGKAVASSDSALLLKEAAYPPVIYIPREDADLSFFERSTSSSYCPYKCDASYYHISVDGTRSDDAVWTYDAPYEAVSPIKSHFAFYPSRVDAIS